MFTLIPKPIQDLLDLLKLDSIKSEYENDCLLDQELISKLISCVSDSLDEIISVPDVVEQANKRLLLFGYKKENQERFLQFKDDLMMDQSLDDSQAKAVGSMLDSAWDSGEIYGDSDFEIELLNLADRSKLKALIMARDCLEFMFELSIRLEMDMSYAASVVILNTATSFLNDMYNNTELWQKQTTLFIKSRGCSELLHNLLNLKNDQSFSLHSLGQIKDKNLSRHFLLWFICNKYIATKSNKWLFETKTKSLFESLGIYTNLIVEVIYSWDETRAMVFDMNRN